MNARTWILAGCCGLFVCVGSAWTQEQRTRKSDAADLLEKKMTVLFDQLAKELAIIKDVMSKELKILREELDIVRKERARAEAEAQAQLLNAERQFKLAQDERARLERLAAERKAKEEASAKLELNAIPLKNARAADVVKVIQELLREDAKRLRLAADTRTNMVLLYCQRDDAELVRMIARLLDEKE